MHDAAGVRSLERREQIAPEAQHLGPRDGPSAEAIGKRLALEVFHDVEGHPIGLAVVVDRDDVLVAEAGEGLRLLAEPPHGQGGV